jgi:hypothetical protein
VTSTYKKDLIERAAMAVSCILWFALAVGLGGGAAEARDVTYAPAGLRLWIPDSWHADDSRGVLAAVDQRQEVVFALKAVPAQSIQQALAQFDAEMAQVVTGMQPNGSPQQLDVNGLQAIGVDAKGYYQGTPVDMTLMVIEAPSGQMAMLHLICESSSLQRHRADISQVLTSVAPASGGFARGPAPSTGGARGNGMVTYQATAPTDENHAPFMTSIFETQAFPFIASVISQAVVLPRNLNIVAGACGEINAQYLPDKHAILLCYELAPFFFNGFIGLGESPQQAMQNTANALVFVLLHELGHGLIGELDIGITGGEEDAVDDFAALLLVGAQNAKAAQDGAMALLHLGTLNEKPVFWDEHSFGEQRFFNVLCVIYGSDPDAHSEMVPLVLPPPRARRCADEFRKKKKAWDAMLAPFARLQN